MNTFKNLSGKEKTLYLCYLRLSKGKLEKMKLEIKIIVTIGFYKTNHILPNLRGRICS